MTRRETPGSRVRVERNWALLPPEAVAESRLPEWEQTAAKILAAPALGAGFAQYDLALAAGGGTQQTLPESIEAFLFVLAGSVRCDLNGSGRTFTTGGFAYMKPGSRFMVTADAPARLLWLKKRYVPFGGTRPYDVVGHEHECPAAPLAGAEGLSVKSLLPADPAWDLAMNLFTFEDGASLPVVESHVMEHGLVMLEGRGEHGFGREWVEVQAGDFLWLGPYVPQSFRATGGGPARFIASKDVHRDVAL